MSLADKLKHPSKKIFSWKPRPEILLCANIPKPMSGVAPRVVMGQDWWNRVRRAAYWSTSFHCAACGVHQTEAKEFHHLEGHELYKINYPRGLMIYQETVPLCHYCHSFIHSGRLQALMSRGEIPHKRYNEILKHGKKVLRDAKLKKPEPYKGPIAEWRRWRMVLNGVKYPPLYKDLEEWCRAFGYEFIDDTEELDYDLS